MKLPAVGLFDSGLGGLSVLAALQKVLDADYLYLGDNGRAPYGSRTADEIVSYTREGCRLLLEEGAEAIVLACNTATAVCVEELRKSLSVPVVGVEPAIAPAARAFDSVLVLATPATASSGRLARLISKFPRTRFEILPLPHLARAVEDLFLKEIPLSLSGHLPAAVSCGCAVLGCTHYSLIRRQIGEYWKIPLFDGAEGTARRVESLFHLGMDDHRLSPRVSSEFPLGRVKFIGKSANLNQAVYFRNICFQYFRKKF